MRWHHSTSGVMCHQNELQAAARGKLGHWNHIPMPPIILPHCYCLAACRAKLASHMSCKAAERAELRQSHLAAVHGSAALLPGKPSGNPALACSETSGAAAEEALPGRCHKVITPA